MKGIDHLDARPGHRRRRLQARARQGHPDRRLRLDAERHVDRLRRARLRLRQACKAAKYIAAARAEGARSSSIGGPPVPSITNYTNCFVKAAKTHGLDVVGKQDNVKDTAATAQPIVADLLTKNPDRQAIWTLQRPERARRGRRRELGR